MNDFLDHIRQGRDTRARELVGMRWGLVGFSSSGPDPTRVTFNAKSENLTKSDLRRVPLHTPYANSHIMYL